MMKDITGAMPRLEGVQPIFSHFGMITHSRDAAARFLLSVPGAEITATREAHFTEAQMIVGAPLKIRIHFVTIQGNDIEIIEPFDCPDAYLSRHLREHGEGFHHMAYDFATQEEHQNMVSHLEEQGYQVVFAGKVRDLIVYYVAPSDDSHLVLELKCKV